jgi:hypothetical protein
VASAAAVLACTLLASTPARATVVLEKDDFSLDVGLRIQPRMELERGSTPAWRRDFLVRRTRLKAGGKMHGAQYKFEWKIDSTDRNGATPSASVENAYVQYPLVAGVQVRAGLYDLPYSRDRLTSDSRQLAVDRGEVSNVPDAVGLADNGIGFHFLGKVHGGRAEYAVGLFDNRVLTSAGATQDWPMVVGRVDLNFGATKDVYQDTHFGDDTWCSLGLNGSYQGGIENGGGTGDGSSAAVGVDGMIDVPAGPGRLCARTEFNNVSLVPAVTPNRNSDDTLVWMAGLGYLMFGERLQPIVRFDQVWPDDARGGSSRSIAYAGLNLYQNGHSLKVQGDVRFESATGHPVDGVRLQAQVDF